MIRPNFFIVGAPKCGTTAWHAYLSGHPDIAFARVKEPHYFNTDMEGFRWVRSEAEYLELFLDCGGAKAVGEASVQYLASGAAAENIARFAPDARILIFLRDPAPYLQSYHNQLLLNCDEDIESFRDAWKAGGNRPVPSGCRDPKLIDYRMMGRFSEQVARFLDHFDAAQVKVVRFERWTRDTRAVYMEILDFLGLEDDGRQDFAKVHEAKHVGSQKLARLTQRPPGVVLALARMIRTGLGLKRLRLAHRLRRLNYRKGYHMQNDTSVMEEIKSYFETDQTVLNELIRATQSAEEDVRNHKCQRPQS